MKKTSRILACACLVPSALLAAGAVSAMWCSMDFHPVREQCLDQGFISTALNLDCMAPRTGRWIVFLIYFLPWLASAAAASIAVVGTIGFLNSTRAQCVALRHIYVALSPFWLPAIGAVAIYSLGG